MARLLDQSTIDQLNASGLKATILCELYIPSGNVYLCDDVDDLTATVNSITNVYIGASVLFGAMTISSSSPLAAEPVTIILDGAKLHQAGLPSALDFYNQLLEEDYQQKRVNFYLAIQNADTLEIVSIWNLYAGKINSIRQVDEAVSILGDKPVQSNLEVILDSLAARYNRTIGRVRTHEDQLEIDPTDKFYSYVSAASKNERNIYWGKAAPTTYVAPSYSYRNGSLINNSNNKAV